MTPDGTRWRYRYDPFGRRIAKERLAADGTVAELTRFSWDGSTLAEQATAAGATTWDWEEDGIHVLTQRELSQDTVDARFYAIVTDIVGAPVEMVTPDGRLVRSTTTTLWGTTTTTGTADCPLRFPGQYHDPETGLHYNHHRHYDPHTARYASPDPLGREGGPDPYGYVSNPTVSVDPLGLTPCWSIKGRMKAAGPGDEFGLPSSGKIRYVPPKGYDPAQPLPRGPQSGYIDRFGNEWVVGPSRTPGHPFEWDVQLSRTGRAQLGKWTRDGSHLNVSPLGEVTHK